MFELTPEEIEALRTAQPQIRALKSLIDRAERAGIDLGAERAELERREKMVHGFLREFGQRGNRTATN